MLNIEISFQDSWTNQFLDEHRNPLFTSMSGFNAKQQKLSNVVFNSNTVPQQTLVEHVRQQNRNNPGMALRVPATYDNTVRGVVARLLGEVRRLSNLDAKHPLHSVWNGMTYTLDISSEESQLVSLATIPNDLQGSGAGVLEDNLAAYKDTPVTHRLFGHLEHNLKTIMDNPEVQGTWFPKEPLDLIRRLSELEDEKKYLKYENPLEWPTRLNRFSTWLKNELMQTSFESIKPKEPGQSNLGNPDKWNLAGAMTVLRIYQLSENDRSNAIAQEILTPRGGFGGLAMKGNIGIITIKDLYASTKGGKRAVSTRMPYQSDMWVEHNGKKMSIPVGVIKKTGNLRISIVHPNEYELAKRIQDTSVSTFQFGKKGLAFVKNIYVS